MPLNKRRVGRREGRRGRPEGLVESYVRGWWAGRFQDTLFLHTLIFSPNFLRELGPENNSMRTARDRGELQGHRLYPLFMRIAGCLAGDDIYGCSSEGRGLKIIQGPVRAEPPLERWGKVRPPIVDEG